MGERVVGWEVVGSGYHWLVQVVGGLVVGGLLVGGLVVGGGLVGEGLVGV